MPHLLTIDVVWAIMQDHEREILRRTQLAAARRVAATPRRRVARRRRYATRRVRPAV